MEAIVAMLGEIRDELRLIRVALETMTGLLEVAFEPEPWPAPASGCSHPVEARADFGMTNGIAHWQCRACGYDSLKAAA
jgi:hypothetical protein